MDKCTDVPLKDQLQVGGWSSPALTKKALDEIERLEAQVAGIELLQREIKSLERQVIGYFRALQATGKPIPEIDERPGAEE